MRPSQSILKLALWLCLSTAPSLVYTQTGLRFDGQADQHVVELELGELQNEVILGLQTVQPRAILLHIAPTTACPCVYTCMFAGSRNPRRSEPEVMTAGAEVDGLIIDLIQGRPRATFVLGHQQTVAACQRAVNDGQPHTLRLIRQGRALWMTVDQGEEECLATTQAHHDPFEGCLFEATIDGIDALAVNNTLLSHWSGHCDASAPPCQLEKTTCSSHGTPVCTPSGPACRCTSDFFGPTCALAQLDLFTNDEKEIFALDAWELSSNLLTTLRLRLPSATPPAVPLTLARLGANDPGEDALEVVWQAHALVVLVHLGGGQVLRVDNPLPAPDKWLSLAIRIAPAALQVIADGVATWATAPTSGYHLFDLTSPNATLTLSNADASLSAALAAPAATTSQTLAAIADGTYYDGSQAENLTVSVARHNCFSEMECFLGQHSA
ncbi:uncharacterized protein MONBRDRAFT_26505 [Monosiga brevicollis MX1]|uniref:EGF-like domain-containing protein n=1 Tax=Monosiga brevicollis TaxID=81824 RepID=A9V2K0_MONBE|nr:uncharacterized protein MONBRDRAFT_26505 [Monosiga brevicollis MX1]EDQ88390.1 predicted protein [Monosiga brevicollis MX1]|eukprot:XP_001746983.1 hypothetical protein [Monosiga brevicollis MX1]